MAKPFLRAELPFQATQFLEAVHPFLEEAHPSQAGLPFLVASCQATAFHNSMVEVAFLPVVPSITHLLAEEESYLLLEHFAS